jgi:hypothetical protein
MRLTAHEIARDLAMPEPTKSAARSRYLRLIGDAHLAS